MMATFLVYMGLPMLLVIVSFWKRNIVAIIAAIVSLSVVAAPVASAFGVWILAPIVLLIIGLAVILLRDALGRGIEV